MLALVIFGLASLASLAKMDYLGTGIIDVTLICLKQLGVLFIAMSGAVLFSKMLPGIEPIIESSGIRGGRTN